MLDFEYKKIPYQIKNRNIILWLTLKEIKEGLHNEDAPVFKKIRAYLNCEENAKKRNAKKPYDYLVYRKALFDENGERHFLKDCSNKKFIDKIFEKSGNKCWIVGKGTKVYRIVAEIWLEQTVDNVTRNIVHHVLNNGLGPKVENLIWLTKEEHYFMHRK